jgi:hypothetical protein
MAQFKAYEDGVEVNGQTVLSVVDGMRAFSDTAKAILASRGIADPQPGQWYRQQNWLDAFQEISERIGPGTLFSIGQTIPQNAEFPPEIDNIVAALSAINVAYHMNHRIGDKVLFDPTNGTIHEGIGHYIFEPNPEGKQEGIMRCPNPYPCDFDRGIIQAMADRFKPLGSGRARVEHAEGDCRKHGAEACTYNVSW